MMRSPASWMGAIDSSHGRVYRAPNATSHDMMVNQRARRPRGASRSREVRMRSSRIGLVARALAIVAALGLLIAVAPRPAGAYGPLAVYQVTFSQSCNNPSFCGANLGGFWGWAEFDSDGTADAQLTGCGHLTGGHDPATNGASHFSASAQAWSIDPTTGTFWTANETDTFVGHGTPVSVFNPVPQDTGIPAAPGHYSTSDLLGFNPPPGVTFQVQVVKIPNR
jgi:hypothetical protein